MRDYFSDRELGKKELKSEEIPATVYNGVVGLYNKYHKNFSKNFPAFCPDSKTVCGTDEDLLESAVQALIPEMSTPVRTIYDWDSFNKYALLDFVEFCYDKIVDYNDGYYHSFFKHHHLSFTDNGQEKEKFRKELNEIFSRNGIVFYLDVDGNIKRHLPTQMDFVLNHLNVKSSDQKLNELVNAAIENIRKPKEFERQVAIEKIWDAFERVKTFYDPNNKKKSANTLISNISAGTDKFEELLDSEFDQLTKIGNDYQIRHFERNRLEIMTAKQIDYLFYRMIALIDLCMDTVSDDD